MLVPQQPHASSLSGVNANFGGLRPTEESLREEILLVRLQSRIDSRPVLPLQLEHETNIRIPRRRLPDLQIRDSHVPSVVIHLGIQFRYVLG